MQEKVPYYVVKKGRGYFQPNQSLKARGFKSVPCGRDSPEARARAAEIARSANGGRMSIDNPNSEVRKTLYKSWKNAKERAAKRKMSFEIEFDYVLGLVKSAGGVCAVSNIPFHTINSLEGVVRQPYHPSIDRKDNALGYIKGNVRVVVTAVNYAMNQWGEEFLIELMRSIKSGSKAKK